MICQTSQLLLGSAPPGRLIGFVFFSTICSYNFHAYLTPRSVNSSRRSQWTQHHKALHFVFYLAGGVGAAVYFFYLLPHAVALAFSILVSFGYSAPKLPYPFFRRMKRKMFGKTIFLALVWTYVTTVLPVLVADTPWNGRYTLFAASRFFFIFAICILFDYRDRECDRGERIRSLVTLLNESGIDRLFGTTLFGFAFCSIGMYGYHYPAFDILLLLIPGIILALLYPSAKRDFSDYLYSFVLDGLLMFSGLLTLIFRI